MCNSDDHKCFNLEKWDQISYFYKFKFFNTGLKPHQTNISIEIIYPLKHMLDIHCIIFEYYTENNQYNILIVNYTALNSEGISLDLTCLINLKNILS